MRVSSPSAAKSGAASRTWATANALDRDMLLDVLELTGPAAFVHAERFVAPVRRQLVEARLGDGEQRAFLRLVEPELDERHRLLRVVDLRIDRVRMPAVGEEL